MGDRLTAHPTPPPTLTHLLHLLQKEEHSAQRSQLKEFRNQIKELRSAGVGKKLISLSSFGLGCVLVRAMRTFSPFPFVLRYLGIRTSVGSGDMQRREA